MSYIEKLINQKAKQYGLTTEEAWQILAKA